MKILHYVENFSLKSETFIYDLINNLENIDVNNYVLSHTRVLEKERKFSKVKIITQKKTVFDKVLLKFSIGKYNLKSRREIKKYILTIKPDIIHAHFGTNGVKIFNLLTEYNLKIPMIISFHGYDVNVVPRYDNIYIKLLQQTDKYSNIIYTSPSNFLKNKIVKLGLNENKIKVIPNAYNDYFNKEEKRFFWQYGDELKILNIGRFSEVKGQKYLIEAFSKIEKYYPNSTLTLIGFGSLENDLKLLASELNISDKIVFQEVQHSQLPKIVASHDIYIHPSIISSDGAEESFSVSLIEAQVVGLASIITDIGGMKEIVIDNKTGKIIPQKDVQSIYEAIKFYIDNPKILKTHSINAKINAQERFDKRRIIVNITNLYKGIL